MESVRDRSLATFRLSPTLKHYLLNAGFRTVGDLENMGPIELSKELGCSHREALAILKTIQLDLMQGRSSSISTESSVQTDPVEVPLPGNEKTNQLPSNSVTLSPSKSSDISQKISLRGLPLIEGHSAFELLEREVSQVPIVTFNKELDEMLGGGVPVGKITEFCGVPGIGKTQIGMQLAVDVHIPLEFGGAEGECIYIDTEGSFMVERVVEIANALVQHLTAVTESLNNNNNNNNSNNNNNNNNNSNNNDSKNNERDKILKTKLPAVEDILAHIYYYRVTDYIEQIALINILHEVLQKYRKVKLIVIDSITFHFRHDFDDLRVRTRLLNQIAAQLMAIASDFQVAVVLMNQMTTKLDSGIIQNESLSYHHSSGTLIPALGESWAHNCTQRVLLQWSSTDHTRIARLLKSPSQQHRIAHFQITPDGIR